jgi:hypothetical protein
MLSAVTLAVSFLAQLPCLQLYTVSCHVRGHKQLSFALTSSQMSCIGCQSLSNHALSCRARLSLSQQSCSQLSCLVVTVSAVMLSAVVLGSHCLSSLALSCLCSAVMFSAVILSGVRLSAAIFSVISMQLSFLLSCSQLSCLVVTVSAPSPSSHARQIHRVLAPFPLPLR